MAATNTNGITANGTPPPVYVTVSALDAGHLTLPERLFVTDADPHARSTVPSLSFLIQHPSTPSDSLASFTGTSTTPPAPTTTTPEARGRATTTNLLFDLGLKRDLARYAPAQQAHITQRHPIVTSPDCAASLRAGGFDDLARVDAVVLSHVHWDHVGTPSDFPGAVFVVGRGTAGVLRRGAGPLYPREIFNADELPRGGRTVELPGVPGRELRHAEEAEGEGEDERVRVSKHGWRRLGGDGDGAGALPWAVDFFGDGSVYVVDAPGHLDGHVNLLARVGARRWVYLGGDCCHDPRILAGERGIAMYDDGSGGMRSVHVDTEAARGTLDKIKAFLEAGSVDGEGPAEVEVVVAHDKGWREKNRHRFFPGKL